MHLLDKFTKNNKFLFLILLFIAFDVLCDNYIASSFNDESPTREFWFFVGLLLLQIIVSPIQTGISDFYGRKISLIFSMTFSLLSLLFVFLYDSHALPYLSILVLIVLAKGLFGNTIPICWAAVGDMEGKNFRFSFALATASYALGFLILICLHKFFSDVLATLSLVLSFVFILFLCARYFFDLKDIKLSEIRKVKTPFFVFVWKEVLLIGKEIRKKSNQALFIAWILWEISIYIILALYADFITNHDSSVIVVVMMLGYLCGTLSMRYFPHVADSKMIRIGYKISAASLIPYFILVCFVKNIDLVLSFCYFFHAIGNAILSPTLFSIVSKKGNAHERGKIYGLVESGDTIAFLISGILILTYKHLQLDIFYMVCFSLLSVLVSWIPYRRYEKISEKAAAH